MMTPSFDIEAFIHTTPPTTSQFPASLPSQSQNFSTPSLHSREANSSGYPLEQALLDPSRSDFMQQDSSVGGLATANWVASTNNISNVAAADLIETVASAEAGAEAGVDSTIFDTVAPQAYTTATSILSTALSASALPVFSAQVNRELYKQSIVAHHGQLLQSRTAQLHASAQLARPPLGIQQSARGAGDGRTSSSVSRASQSSTRSQKMSLQERRRLSRQLLRQQKSAAPTFKSKSDNKRTVERSNNDSVAPVGNKIFSSIGLEHGGAMQDYSEAAALSANRRGLQDDLIYQGVFPHSGRPLIRGTGGSYSTSGFDIFDVLTRVVQRPNPRIKIGPVDFSCSFTVVSALDPEQPIIYASDTFCHLTGYQQREVIGRNCRLLQSPCGDAEAGAERPYTDMGAVSHFKKHLSVNSECQASLINYRKDGQPFINLVTIVPIPARDSNETEFFVGFQVDLVEQPKAIIQRSQDGTCVVNYSSPPQDDMDIEEEDEQPLDTTSAEYLLGKQTLMAHELGDAIGRGTNEARQWARLLLDNSHDLIYVLSLKGIFLYVSPSVKRLLGYAADELVGRSISEFCHPSDVVPVFRELKDSTNNSSIASATRRSWRHETGTNGPVVNLMMRMRHEDGHYIWIESSGKLHLEQGKGRKVVVSSARQRPISDLAWKPVRKTGHVKQPSFWSKMSTDGLILSSTTPVLNVLGKTAHSMSGLHLTELTQPSSIPDLLRALQSSSIASVRHALADSSGFALPIVSTFFPAVEETNNVRTKFVWSRLTDSNEIDNIDLDLSDAKAAVAAENPGETPTVFEELSTSRSSSWVFELHQLQNVNRRLREEVRMVNTKTRVALQELEPSQPPLPASTRAGHEHTTRSASISKSAEAKHVPHWLGTAQGSTSGSGTDSSISVASKSASSLFDKNSSGSDDPSATSVSERSHSSDGGSANEQPVGNSTNAVPKRGIKRKA